jgi:lysophospholipase L1-like esterase
VTKDSQVIVIGDSFINWLSHSFPEQLAATTKQEWRMEAVGGTSMGSGGIGPIPEQFDLSILLDPDAHTVLMDGGGNDVLVPDLGLDAFGACKETGSSTNENCNMIIQLAIDAASELMNRMASAGIRDVVYFFYPHIPEDRLIGGPHPNEILDYALPKVKKFCDSTVERTNGKLRCTFIDMIPAFKGHDPFKGDAPDWFNDDIHPNDLGSQAMVNKVWEVMTDKCIGQKDKTCCEP